MNLLVVGGGGREHAIIKKVKENPAVETVYALPGNGGIAADAVCVPEIGAKDIGAIVDFARAHAVDFAVVAPDDPLALGCVDRLHEAGIPCFGPEAKAARIEASKVFAKNLMQKYNIPTARYEVFDDPARALAYLRALSSFPVVVKADGLALGKGVLIVQNLSEAEAAVKTMMEDLAFGDSGKEIVIEEFLTGPEVSVLAFTDGTAIVPMVSSMDHKRARRRRYRTEHRRHGHCGPQSLLHAGNRPNMHGHDLSAHPRGYAGRGLPLQGLSLLRADVDARWPQGH